MQRMGAESTEFRWGALLNPVLFDRVGAVYRTLPKAEPIHRTIVQPQSLVTIEILPRPSKSKAVRDKPIKRSLTKGAYSPNDDFSRAGSVRACFAAACRAVREAILN
jgi:hypothetical protein